MSHAEVVLRNVDSMWNNDNVHGQDEIHYEDSSNLSRIRLAYRYSKYLLIRGAYSHADRLARKAVEWSENVDDGSRQTNWSMRGNLATILRYQGRSVEAKIIDEELLGCRRTTLGDDHCATMSSLNNSGLTLQCLGGYQESEMMHRQAMSRVVELLGKEHVKTLSSMNNLAMSLQEQQELQAAKEIVEELVSLKAKVLGADRLDTLLSFNNLGVVSQQGHLAEARGKSYGGSARQGEALGTKVSPDADQSQQYEWSTSRPMSTYHNREDGAGSA